MKILIVDKIHDILIEKLSNAGYFCDYKPKITALEIEENISLYHGLIIRSKTKITKHIIDKAFSLKFIGRVGAGLENIDVAYAESKGIVCFNSPEGNRDAVGEQAVGMLLMLANNLYNAHKQVCNGIWQREQNRGWEIKGKTVGIIGFGNMGRAFAQRLMGFDCRIIAYDKYKTGFSNKYVSECTMNEIFNETDILSLHVPLTLETNYLVNNEYINKFHKNIVIINTSRGQVVNTAELVENLKSGKIKGVALDVLEYESITFENLFSSDIPEPLRFLAQSKNVVLSPHIAGWTHESNMKLSAVIADKIVEHFGNK